VAKTHGRNAWGGETANSHDQWHQDRKSKLKIPQPVQGEIVDEIHNSLSPYWERKRPRTSQNRFIKTEKTTANTLQIVRTILQVSEVTKNMLKTEIFTLGGDGGTRKTRRMESRGEKKASTMLVSEEKRNRALTR